MKKLDQIYNNPKRGDCTRACIASMFELDMEQVPHFALFKGDWFKVLYHFLQGIDCDLIGYCKDIDEINRKFLINGCISACVPSKKFPGHLHSVLINSVGRVIHDPSESKGYLNVNVIKTGEIKGWDKIVRKVIR